MKKFEHQKLNSVKQENLWKYIPPSSKDKKIFSLFQRNFLSHDFKNYTILQQWHTHLLQFNIFMTSDEKKKKLEEPKIVASNFILK